MQQIIFSKQNFVLIISYLEHDGVCIFPSDTSYGFSANPFSQKAIEHIQVIKDRQETKPFLLLVADFQMAKKYGRFSPKMAAFAESKWQPSHSNPTTVLVPKKRLLTDFFPHSSLIGLRVPHSQEIQDFLRQWQRPLISTSANLSGSEPIFSKREIHATFSEREILFCSAGDLSVQSVSQIWKEEEGEIIRVR